MKNEEEEGEAEEEGEEKEEVRKKRNNRVGDAHAFLLFIMQNKKEKWYALHTKPHLSRFTNRLYGTAVETRRVGTKRGAVRLGVEMSSARRIGNLRDEELI